MAFLLLKERLVKQNVVWSNGLRAFLFPNYLKGETDQTVWENILASHVFLIAKFFLVSCPGFKRRFFHTWDQVNTYFWSLCN